MPHDLEIVSVVGARPQFVKLAPVSKAFQALGEVCHRVAHTGQHYDERMSATFFEQLELPAPDIDFGIGSGSHAAQTGAMMQRMETYLEENETDAILVYGDTNSTLAATLAAVKLHVKVLHIEAGLRSFDRGMPEEVNRLVADHCGDRLYAPTPRAMHNLEAENLAERSIMSGDVMLDAVNRNIEIASRKSTVLRDLALEPGAFGVVTVHRASNTTREFIGPLMDTLAEIAVDVLPLIFPVHPRTRVLLNQAGYRPPANLRLVEPLAYLDIITLVQAASIIITDSGGVQKEAAFLETPCLTLRRETEWTETVTLGVNHLVPEISDLPKAVLQVLGAENIFNVEMRKQLAINYGEGHAAEKIALDCVQWLSSRVRP